jgi:hypothetical protein
VVRILSAHERPDEVLLTYLRRPVPGFSFLSGLRQVVGGQFPRIPRPAGVTDQEVVNRAVAVLAWLDGDRWERSNPFKVLGLSYSAGEPQIVRQFRALSKRVHPDLHPAGRQDYWETRQREVNEAYRQLMDPDSRERWRNEVKNRHQIVQWFWRVERIKG